MRRTRHGQSYVNLPEWEAPSRAVHIIEGVAEALAVLPEEQERTNDDHHADDVPPHRDVAEELHEVHVERVEQAVDSQHHEVGDEQCPFGRRDDRLTVAFFLASFADQ